MGFYPYDEVDGVWGNKSVSAWAAYRAKYPESDLMEAAIASMEVDPWEHIRHWTREEFRCHCGGKYCNGFPEEPDITLVSLLEMVRRYYNAPAICSSGVRCPEHNANVGGVANSKHLSGKAADFMVLGVSGQELLKFVQALPDTNYAYIIDNGPYVHVDVN